MGSQVSRKIYVFRIFAYISRNRPNFTKFSDFSGKTKICTYHERSNFGVKKCRFFFRKKKSGKSGQKHRFSRNWAWDSKMWTSQNCSRMTPHRLMLFKNSGNVRFRRASHFSFFKNILEISKISKKISHLYLSWAIHFWCFQKMSKFSKYFEIAKNYWYFQRISGGGRRGGAAPPHQHFNVSQAGGAGGAQPPRIEIRHTQ